MQAQGWNGTGSRPSRPSKKSAQKNPHEKRKKKINFGMASGLCDN
jgi:hypothetical protein